MCWKRDFGLKNNIGFFPGGGDFQRNVLRESRAKHLIIPLLPNSSWEFDDTFCTIGGCGTSCFLEKRNE